MSFRGFRGYIFWPPNPRKCTKSVAGIFSNIFFFFSFRVISCISWLLKLAGKRFYDMVKDCYDQESEIGAMMSVPLFTTLERNKS